jgi:hypothetical protein
MTRIHTDIEEVCMAGAGPVGLMSRKKLFISGWRINVEGCDGAGLELGVQ